MASPGADASIPATHHLLHAPTRPKEVDNTTGDKLHTLPEASLRELIRKQRALLAGPLLRNLPDGGAKAQKRLSALEEALQFVTNPLGSVEQALASFTMGGTDEWKAPPTTRPKYSAERAEINPKVALIPSTDTMNRSLLVENERDPVHRFMRPPLKLIPGDEADRLIEASMRVSLADPDRQRLPAEGGDDDGGAPPARRKAQSRAKEEKSPR